MKVVVEILTGNLLYIQVDDDAKVNDLKQEIEARENLASDRMILVVDHKDRNRIITKEEDGASLVDFGVEDGSHIYLFFSPLNTESSYHHLFTLPESLLG
ncbi:hypothetical protein F3Y22_tig00117034pilonHSYRG00300 [Hibiscus syriacus]|uniref:Ubiquitin-like domain-containing protein n=2 Tax=Hibiscus syriacus TaxID=106335 RepID=A0A6A2WCU3_HIBSY|nr:hypothetical protein F3Y22_tig00117034pilonHSYRG00300 [Hibiscus syriacus]